MDEQQLQAIETRCQRNQGRNDGMIRQDVMSLIAEVRRLQELLDYEEVNHAEAREEVRRLNRINENGWGPDALRKHLREAAGK